ncbi:hypothetical protein IQ31_05423 [Sphingobacterium siyangense]|uniref:Uncharacterized protein n=1 Tax=Sphingobacterium siyangense TaxID=459529 RepID=A0A562M276_9SPHI|nr:hypothetical protein IQ31_05423 [Sphingobacterium siyangense]
MPAVPRSSYIGSVRSKIGVLLSFALIYIFLYFQQGFIRVLNLDMPKSASISKLSTKLGHLN